jgi:hypothetical protein
MEDRYTIRNQSLYSVCEQFMNEAIKRLTTDINLLTELATTDKEIPYTPTIDTLSLKDLVQYMISIRKEVLTSLPEYAKYKQLMKEDPHISKQVDKQYRIRSMIQYVDDLTHWPHWVSGFIYFCSL